MRFLFERTVVNAMNDFELQVGQYVIDKYRREKRDSTTFDLLDLKWDLLDDVWPPYYAPGAEWFRDWIPFGEIDSFLEMGCGTGVMAVLGALSGCARVVALDINPAAVRNAQLNAVRHGVAHGFDARESDLFTALAAGERFDAMYWNPPILDGPPDMNDVSGIHQAMFDSDHSRVRRFLTEGVHHLTPDGRIYISFSDSAGKLAMLTRDSLDAGLSLEIIRTFAMAEVPEALADAFSAEMVESLKSEESYDSNETWDLHLLELRPKP